MTSTDEFNISITEALIGHLIASGAMDETNVIEQMRLNREKVAQFLQRPIASINFDTPLSEDEADQIIWGVFGH